MELHDIARRIFGRHWLLIACFVAAGAAAAVLIQAAKTDHYTASTRLALDTKDPETRAESQSIADTAAAIATSPAQVQRALLAAHVANHSAVHVAGNDVSVQGVGSSDIVQLSVTDRNPRVAAAIANALAQAVIRARLAVTGGQLRDVVAQLDRQTRRLNARIARLDTTDPRDVAAISLRDSLIRQRDNLDSARATALATDAQRPRAAVISAAGIPRHADDNGGAIEIALGAVLGLILGVGIAALLETIRPTLVGRAALAKELDAPVLGEVGGHENGTDGDGAAAAAARMALAANTAGVRKISLVSPDPTVDMTQVAGGFEAWADYLHTNGGGSKTGEGERGVGTHLAVEPLNLANPKMTNGAPTGLVVVSPTTVKRQELDDVVDLLRVAPGPLLGVVTYTENGKRQPARDLMRRMTAARSNGA